MTHRTANRPLPFTTRITAIAAILLVLALGIFSASPVLHAWLHARESVSHAAGQATAGHLGDAQGDHGQPRNDDGCAVTLFAHGALPLLIAVLLALVFRRTAEITFTFVAAVHRATPRYWLPPLCGPPLN